MVYKACRGYEMSKQKSRRQFLEEFGAFSSGAAFLNSPLNMFISSVIGSSLTSSMAHAQSVKPRRYVNIQLYGAPPRWMFDLMMNAYGANDTPILNSPMIGTRYVDAARYTDLEYRTVLKNGIRVPLIWQNNVPAPGVGNTRPMSDLLNNYLSLQGITTENPGHPGSSALHFRPSGAKTTLGALSADGSDAFIPAVNMTAQYFMFLSLKGKSPVTLNTSGNMIQTLLDPFISQASADFKTNKAKVNLKAALSAATSALNTATQTDQLNSQTLIESQKSAENLLNSSFGNLTTEWTTLKAKYQDLITRSLAMTLPGINDKIIGSADTAARGGEYQLRVEGNIVRFADLRELVSLTTLNVGRMADQFALTEYVLKNNLSYSITMSFDHLIGLKTLAGSNTAATHNSDEHYTGKVPSLLLNSLFFTAISSCLLELISILKTVDIWKDTVIDFGGEFNRHPNSLASGSEHGFKGKSVSLFSGAFNNTMVLGNVSASTNMNLSWGLGTPVAMLGSQLRMTHMAATIAHLLGTPNPVTSASSLVTLIDGTLTANYELAKRT